MADNQRLSTIQHPASKTRPFIIAFPMVKDAFASTQSLKGYSGEDLVEISRKIKEINKQIP